MIKIGEVLRHPGIQATIFLITVAYTLSFCFWGRGCEDPYYWLNIYETVNIKHSLSAGTSIIGHLWGTLFGFRILPFRLLGWLCCCTALCLPFFVIVPGSDWFKACNIFPLSISMMLMGYGTFNEFSPGTLSFLFLSIIALVLSKFWNSRNLLYPIAIGIFSGLAVWCRFPNVLVCIVILAAIFTKGILKKEDVKNCIYAAVAYIIALVLFLCFASYFTIGTFNYFEAITSSFSIGNSGGHSTQSLLDGMIDGANDLLFYIAAAFLFQLFEKSKSGQNQPVFIVLVFLLFAFFLKENIGVHKWFNREFHSLISAICICMLLLANYKLFKSPHQSKVICLDFCFLILMILPFGSDTGWLKLFPALLVPIPYMAKMLEINWKNITGDILLIGLICISILCYFNNNISKGSRDNLLKMTEKAEVDVLKGIHISKNNKAYINNLINNVNQYAPKGDVIFYGDASHFAYAVTNVKRRVDHPFFCSPYDTLHISRVIQSLQEDEAVLFDFEMHDYDFLHKELERLGYALICEGENYNIFDKLRP